MTRRNSVARLGSFINFRELRIESLEDRRLLALVPELVADIDGFISKITSVNDQLYFERFDGTSEYDLWWSGGTEHETSLLAHLQSDATGLARISDFIAAGASLYFSYYHNSQAEDELDVVRLIRVDLNTAQASAILERNARCSGECGIIPDTLLDRNGVLYLSLRSYEPSSSAFIESSFVRRYANASQGKLQI